VFNALRPILPFWALGKNSHIDKKVTPHRLRASVATILLDAGMPLDQVQKFLRHKRISTTQIYAETSLHGMGENYIRALAGKR
jgi:integrase/recombinase XerD